MRLVCSDDCPESLSAKQNSFYLLEFVFQLMSFHFPEVFRSQGSDPWDYLFLVPYNYESLPAPKSTLHSVMYITKTTWWRPRVDSKVVAPSVPRVNWKVPEGESSCPSQAWYPLANNHLHGFGSERWHDWHATNHTCADMLRTAHTWDIFFFI